MASCTSCISSCVSAAATRPAETGQHPDRDPVAPVEQRVLFDERLRAVEHHGKNLHARLLGQREGPRLETVNLAVLGARTLREYGHRSAARNPEFAVADHLLQRFGSAAAVDADVAVQDEVLPEEGGLEDLALGDPAEIERNVVKRRNVDHRIVVQHDDVTLLPVHVLPADHPLPPPGRTRRRRCGPECATVRAPRGGPCRKDSTRPERRPTAP